MNRRGFLLSSIAALVAPALPMPAPAKPLFDSFVGHLNGFTFTSTETGLSWNLIVSAAGVMRKQKLQPIVGKDGKTFYACVISPKTSIHELVCGEPITFSPTRMGCDDLTIDLEAFDT